MDLKIGLTHPGVSTKAEWARSLKQRGNLLFDQSFQFFLENTRYPYWPQNKLPVFPIQKSGETETCQPFVDNVINLIAKDEGYEIKVDGGFHANSTALQSKQRIESAYETVSFSRRKPDVVIYNGNLGGACAISILGDVKGRRSDTADFPDAEIGHILDMSKVLLDEHQFSRTLLYSFLTDGYRFQFFKCERGSNSFTFQSSSVFVGLDGWQVVSGGYFH